MIIKEPAGSGAGRKNKEKTQTVRVLEFSHQCKSDNGHELHHRQQNHELDFNHGDLKHDTEQRYLGNLS